MNDETKNDISYEIECIAPHCGRLVSSFWKLDRCPHCGSTSINVVEETAPRTASWENNHTEHFI